MKTTLLLVFLAAVMRVPFSQSYMFFFIPDEMSWSDAQSYCQQHHTDLASMGERSDLEELVRSVARAYTGDLWIGLHRRDASAPWVWSDGSGSTFMPWAPSQPNNWESNQFCAALCHSGTLNDLACGTRLPFVCYTERSRQTARLTVASDQDVNDPALTSDILLKIEQILQEKGLPDYAKLSWKNQSDGNVFQQIQKSDDAP